MVLPSLSGISLVRLAVNCRGMTCVLDHGNSFVFSFDFYVTVNCVAVKFERKTYIEARRLSPRADRLLA